MGFNQDADTVRLTTMISCALVYYLYRMGIFGGWMQIPVGNNNGNNNNNNNNGRNINLGDNNNNNNNNVIGGNNNNNLDAAGLAAVMQELERNNNNNMQFLSNYLLQQQPGIRRELQTFLIGFLGSLLPSWNAPNLVEAEVRARNN